MGNSQDDKAKLAPIGGNRWGDELIGYTQAATFKKLVLSKDGLSMDGELLGAAGKMGNCAVMGYQVTQNASLCCVNGGLLF
jgi:hypothetical protein